MARKRSVERIPPDLEKWIKDEGEVRDDPNRPFAGMCGGIVKRKNGSQNGGQWCQRAAGWNTDHPGFGRCFHHEEQGPQGDEGALPPWTGPLTDEEWNALVGGRAPGGEMRHGAHFILKLKRTWEEWLEEALDPEELHAYKTMPTDPVTLLDQGIKLNRLAMARIQRWLARQRMVHQMNPVEVGGTPRSLEIQQAESQLLKLDTVFARLMEVRARISDAATNERSQEFLEDYIRSLPDDEFAAISAAPERLMLQLNRGARDVRGIGE